MNWGLHLVVPPTVAYQTAFLARRRLHLDSWGYMYPSTDGDRLPRQVRSSLRDGLLSGEKLAHSVAVDQIVLAMAVVGERML